MAGLVNSAGGSPLYLAAESRCKEVLLKILKFLTQVSYNPTLLREAVRGPDGQNPLHAAILSGSSECIGHLLGLEETLELINQPDMNRMTALHFATAARETKLIRQLLNESTLSAYIKDTKGWTPLLEAASSGNFDVFQEILQDFLGLPEMKELVNEPDKEGNTPLHLAIENKNYKMKSLYSYLNGQHAPRAFTLPGDYYSDNGSQGKNNDDQKDYTGESVLIKKASLKVFLVADSLAMCCSMTVVILLVLAMVGDPAFLHSAIIYGKNLLYIALGGTLVAFVTGLFSVIDSESRWVAIVLIVMGSSVPFLIKYLCRKSSISTPFANQLIKGVD
ncbi:ankyrin repeat-containing protein NPR4-like [Pistacia vera]|uniref:ankyrin repeat-containing protein NPR4-like n=1 Tax=Pistacia vera TaxID=55513 RepID=UPI001263990F|nr:ankyrin repeat-containing protein NPR4-like [Pistacia vera]